MGHLLGIGLILISAASFGAMAIFAKFAYLSGISTHSLLFFRFSIALSAMLPIALWQKRQFPRGKDLLVLTAMGMIGYAGQSYCYFTAITLISPALVAILLYLYPVMVALMSVFFLGEALTRSKVLALGSAVFGAILVIGPLIGGNVHNIRGIVLGVTAALIYSVYTIVGGRVMKRNDTFTSSIVVIASAAGFYFFYNVKIGFFFPADLVSWVNILAIALVSTVIADHAYFHGMKLSGAVNASLLSTFEPVTTMFLAAVFLGGRITWLQAVGTVFILSSAVLVVFRPNSQ
jgi:drug/metabolite transporter (DMT)-like permease